MKFFRIGLFVSFLWVVLVPVFGEGPTAPQISVSTHQLTVEIQIGTVVDKGNLVDSSDTFSLASTQLVGWTRVKGAESPIDIKHVWVFEGVEKAVVELPVKSTNFRTWSRKTLYGQAGKWRLDVLGPGGTVIGSKEFLVTEAEKAPETPQE